MPGASAGAVGEITAEDLGELMGGGEQLSDSPAEAPGMSIENMDSDETTSDDAEDSSEEDQNEDENHDRYHHGH